MKLMGVGEGPVSGGICGCSDVVLVTSGVISSSFEQPAIRPPAITAPAITAAAIVRLERKISAMDDCLSCRTSRAAGGAGSAPSVSLNEAAREYTYSMGHLMTPGN